MATYKTVLKAKGDTWSVRMEVVESGLDSSLPCDMRKAVDTLGYNNDALYTLSIETKKQV